MESFRTVLRTCAAVESSKVNLHSHAVHGNKHEDEKGEVKFRERASIVPGSIKMRAQYDEEDGTSSSDGASSSDDESSYGESSYATSYCSSSLGTSVSTSIASSLTTSVATSVLEKRNPAVSEPCRNSQAILVQNNNENAHVTTPSDINADSYKVNEAITTCTQTLELQMAQLKFEMAQLFAKEEEQTLCYKQNHKIVASLRSEVKVASEEVDNLEKQYEEIKLEQNEMQTQSDELTLENDALKKETDEAELSHTEASNSFRKVHDEMAQRKAYGSEMSDSMEKLKAEAKEIAVEKIQAEYEYDRVSALHSDLSKQVDELLSARNASLDFKEEKVFLRDNLQMEVQNLTIQREYMNKTLDGLKDGSYRDKKKREKRGLIHLGRMIHLDSEKPLRRFPGLPYDDNDGASTVSSVTNHTRTFLSGVFGRMGNHPQQTRRRNDDDGNRKVKRQGSERSSFRMFPWCNPSHSDDDNIEDGNKNGNQTQETETTRCSSLPHDINMRVIDEDKFDDNENDNNGEPLLYWNKRQSV